MRGLNTAFAILSLALLWLAPGGVSSAAAEPVLPSGFRDTTLPLEGLQAGEGIDEPTVLRFAPDGKLFVAQKSGKILVYDGIADPTPTLFADLRTEVYNANDRGLLGLALDPDFSVDRPYVYVLYAYDAPPGEEPPFWGQAGEDGDDCPDPPGANTDGCVIQGRLSRLTANLATDKMIGEQPLVTNWCQQFSSHSVGALEFDAEGNLWASGGEGASFENADYGQFGDPVNPCGDPAGIGGTQAPPEAEGGALRSQNFKNLSGSLIRIDPDTGEGVPANPLASSPNINERRLVGKGFRNPFRFAIDPATNEVYVDNVGSAIYEEIDRFTPSPTRVFNSGWPCYEGPQRRELYEFLGLDACQRLYDAPGSTAVPFYYYSHDAGVIPDDPCPYEPGSAISGLAFYEGGSYPPAYDGALFFADAVRGCVYVVRTGTNGRPDPSTVEPFLTEGGLYPGVDIEVGPEGDLFYANLYGPGFGPGAIHRISYDPDAPDARIKATSPIYGATSLMVQFDAGESTDPQEEGLEYEWDLDGNGSYGSPTSSPTESETYALPENRTAAVRVSDEDGHSSVAQLTVYPGDTPPVPTLEAPEESLQWHVGQSIGFEGRAEDSEDGTLPDARLYWRSRLLHCPGGLTSCHSHPLQVFPAVGAGELVAPSHDFPSYIELSLTATDSRGLSASKTVKIAAHPVQLTMISKPAGITLSAGLKAAPSPFDLLAIEDSQITVSAPEKATVDGETFVWSGWSDGGARTHTIVASGSGSMIASYSPTRPLAASGPQPASGRGTGAGPLRLRLSSHPKALSSSRTARFTFTVNRHGADFRCRLDRGRFQPCKSPRVYRRLKSGRHTFAVVATGPGGAVEGTPVKFSWRVLPRRR